MGKEKAIYAPGELEKVRGRLGDVNREEAQRMAKILGGEVGVERDAKNHALDESSGGKRSHSASKSAKSSKTPKRRIELASDEQSILKNPSGVRIDNPDDDPSRPLTQSYSERFKMDKLASQPVFDIKTLSQTMQSMFSFITRPVDLVAPVFVTKRLNEYYKVIENLVVSTRTLLPRNNLKRNEQVRKASFFAYSVLDLIRYWNIERIAGDMAKMQAHPRSVKVKDFAGILQAVYKPLFILEDLSPDVHIKACYKLLYKQLFVENPAEASKYQDVVKNTLSAFVVVRKEIRFRMYPLLMKLVSNKCLPYEEFFAQRRNRIMALINFAETEKIAPVDMVVSPKKNFKSESEEQTVANVENDPLEDARKEAAAAEKKAVEKGLNYLEIMFPEAGWNKLPDYPDMYPYFRGILHMPKGWELIAPTDPVHQLIILARIIEELLIGLRSVTFTALPGEEESEDGERLDEEMAAIINNWHDYIAASLDKEYISRLSEYCQVLAESSEARTSPFARRMVDEMCFAKHFYFFPHLHYTAQNSTTTNTFQKKETPPLYREVRKLRKNLTSIYEEIEKGMKAGGPEAGAKCGGIVNPWKPYVFHVAGPISKRLDALLGAKKRHNASLVLFTLSVTIVLDYFLNNASSWAYNPPKETLFRSIEGNGVAPQFGVDEKIDADAIFKWKLKERAAQKS
jgi:chemotaxis regulatin CheY-phosphate phosphatase CheZ